MFILILLSYKLLKIYDSIELGAFPCLALGAQISPPPHNFYFFLKIRAGVGFIFVFMLILGQVRLDKGQVCPAGLGKRFGQSPPQGLELEIKTTPPYIKKKSKIRWGGVIGAPSAKQGIAPQKKTKSKILVRIITSQCKLYILNSLSMTEIQ